MSAEDARCGGISLPTEGLRVGLSAEPELCSGNGSKLGSEGIHHTPRTRPLV